MRRAETSAEAGVLDVMSPRCIRLPAQLIRLDDGMKGTGCSQIASVEMEGVHVERLQGQVGVRFQVASDVPWRGTLRSRYRDMRMEGFLIRIEALVGNDRLYVHPQAR